MMRKMLRSCVRLSPLITSSTFVTRTEISSVKEIQKLHAKTIKNPDTSEKISVMVSYANLRDYKSTVKIIRESNYAEGDMQDIIQHYGEKGTTLDALTVFQKLRQSKIPISEGVWSSILQLCHKQPDDICSLFEDLVRNDYSHLTSTHISTMFDSLTASDDFKRALELFLIVDKEFYKNKSAIAVNDITSDVLDNLWIEFATKCEKKNRLNELISALSRVKIKSDEVKRRLEKAEKAAEKSSEGKKDSSKESSEGEKSEYKEQPDTEACDEKLRAKEAYKDKMEKKKENTDMKENKEFLKEKKLEKEENLWKNEKHKKEFDKSNHKK